MFLFLQSVYFFLEVNDEQNIYDSKGLKVGSLQVALNIKLFDTNKKTPLNMIDYEDMTDPAILNKWLQITVQLKKATINNEKFTYKTKCFYKWDNKVEETVVIEN